MTDLRQTGIRWADRADDAAVAAYLASVLEGGGPKSIAVPGGRTPGPIFAELARHPLAWDQLSITLTDDRLVPADHPASNFRLLTETLGTTGARLSPLVEGAAVEPFDLVWLGMGADGHIASIFPGCEPADDLPPSVVRARPDPLPPEAPFERLTLTLAALTATRRIMLVVRGAEKRAVLEAAIAGRSSLPIARLLRAARCPVDLFWSAS